MRAVGIFDTLGYEQYKDADDLYRKLTYPIDQQPLPINAALDRKAPLYILETPVRTEGMARIIARVKKARVFYRSFNPVEHFRLSASEAIRHVANSYGVLVPLLSDVFADSTVHNMRAAFVAGLAHGMGKPTLILQEGDMPVPLDVRDFVQSWTSLVQINEYVEGLASQILEYLQSSDDVELPSSGLLASLTFGDPMAENELQTLGSYFIETDQYQRTLRGEANLVVGRKGMGKTALFSQLRNRLRRDKQNIVVDLKPEGYQLLRLKENVLSYLAQGAKDHLVTAFWEYLLYLEVCYKVLEKDHDKHLRDHELMEPYQALAESYRKEASNGTGDFSERLSELSDRIVRAYLSAHGKKEGTQLSSGQVTELVQRNDVLSLSKKLSQYLEYKKSVWILFDNLDRGWSPHGLSADDVLAVRSLIDAGRKIQRAMQKAGHDFHCVIFLRNDVYQLLMNETSDFGKEMRVSLDWNDADLLRELVRSRLASNKDFPSDWSFDRMWAQICVPLIDGTESSQFLIDRCLMRPRNLLKLIAHCRGCAVNMHHQKIQIEDIKRGAANYSTDLVIEIDQELTQIDSSAEGLIYVFINEGAEFSRDDLAILMDIKGIPQDKVDLITEFLLYFGFLGIRVANAEPRYIHDVNYDMKMLKTNIQKHANALRYAVNPAFWSALSIG
jgi:hypothetical protein